MGIFSPSKSTTAFPWEKLTSEEEYHGWIKESSEKPVIFFKHSTRCGTSIMTLRSFENNWTLGKDEANLVFLDLLTNRSLSNFMAAELNVRHESPQAILVKNGKVVYHASHSEISARRIEKLI